MARMLGLDHIAIIVSSEESLRFYEKFGFRECHRFERSYDMVVFMECGSITLEIFIDPKHPERVTDPEAKGLRHIAFTVESLEGVTKVVECEEVRTDWFGRRFTFCKDPDGQPIELKEKTELKEIDQTAKKLADKAPVNLVGEMPVADDEWTEEYKKQFGAEPSFF